MSWVILSQKYDLETSSGVFVLFKWPPAPELYVLYIKCLRIVSGAYKATPVRYLESEMAIPLLDLYFDKWVADFEDLTEVSGMARLLRAAGAKAAELATGRPGNRS
jgi:hypothetical protein